MRLPSSTKDFFIDSATACKSYLAFFVSVEFAALATLSSLSLVYVAAIAS